MNIVWLASWYPNKIIPLDGDFIQRHAIAVSRFTPITVIYVAQYGEDVEIKESKTELFHNGNLTEIVIYFSFKKIGIGIIDKLRYNWKYYSTYKKAIKKHFSDNTAPSLIHVHVPMKAGVIAQWIKKKWNIPYIISEHSATYVKGPLDAFDKRSFYFKNKVASIFRNASAATSVSHHDAAIIRTKFGTKRMDVIHNVVDTNRFFFAVNEKKTRFRFIHVSTMNYQKNAEGIINACGILKKIRQDWEIVFIGRAFPAHINKMIEEFDIKDNVLCTGEISNIMVAGQMQKASALVVFSRYENFPCVIIEALCCGLPVVATNVGGIPEAVNSSNGYLVPSENETALKNAMLSIIDNYHLFNRENISREAAQRYNYDIIGKAFFNLYNHVIPGKLQNY